MIYIYYYITFTNRITMITIRLLTFTVEGKGYRESMREEIARANARAIVSVSERRL